MASPLAALTYWYDALHSPLGIYLRAGTKEDMWRLKWQLNNARARANDPDLRALSITHNPQDVEHELWIVRPQEA